MSAKKCIACNTQMRCIDSRGTKDVLTRRRYECRKCGARKTTVEIDAESYNGRNYHSVAKGMAIEIIKPAIENAVDAVLSYSE